MTPTVTRTLSLTVPAAAVILVAVVVASLVPTAANEESKALMALRDGIDDPEGDLKDWDIDLVNPCTWARIECNDDNRVTGIELRNLNLSGRLAPELGSLELLQDLELAGNNFQGPIPPEYGNMTSLIAMDLFNNNLSGLIPSTIGNLKSLKFLRIDHNRLTGPIPQELAGLSDLVDADFSDNDLCGTIPTGGAFDNLQPGSFDNNPRLKRPGTVGSDGDGDDSGC